MVGYNTNKGWGGSSGGTELYYPSQNPSPAKIAAQFSNSMNEWRASNRRKIPVFNVGNLVLTGWNIHIENDLNGNNNFIPSIERPFIHSPYGIGCENSSSWINLKYWSSYIESKSYGGQPPAAIMYILKINPLVSVTSGVLTITTGQDIYGKSIKGQYSQGVWSIISGVSGWNGISAQSVVLDQTVPLILDKTNAP